MPHAADQRAVAFHQVREELAGLGASGIDGAEITFEKNTSVLVALEDSAFFGGFHRVVAKELFDPHAEVMCEALSIAFGYLRGGDAAAVGTGGAIDGSLDILGDRL